MNRPHPTTLLSILATFAISTQAIADRPAAEDSAATAQAVAEQPAMDSTSQAQQSTPSSVEMMMQQEQQGDVVNLPPREMQAGETLPVRLVDFPRRGMSMDRVRNEFGQPDSESASVGEPPITSWTYSDRIVFFEYSTVIHVVAR